MVEAEMEINPIIAAGIHPAIRPYFNEQQLKQLEDAINTAEETTSGEIVVLVVDQSDEYVGATWKVTLAFTMLASFLAYTLQPHLDTLWLLSIQFAFLAVGFLLGQLWFLKKLFISDAEIEMEFTQRAYQAFIENRVDRTIDRTGILIFVSMKEHRIRILADSGISQKVESNIWDGLVEKLVSEIRAGRLPEGLLQVIGVCGKLLSQYFPRKDGDKNELPNGVRFEK